MEFQTGVGYGNLNIFQKMFGCVKVFLRAFWWSDAEALLHECGWGFD